MKEKYGLKKLVLDWKCLIDNSINIYCNDEIDVKIFKYILENKCDENFGFSIEKTKNGI